MYLLYYDMYCFCANQLQYYPVSQKSEAKIQIVIITTELVRINYT